MRDNRALAVTFAASCTQWLFAAEFVSMATAAFVSQGQHGPEWPRRNGRGGGATVPASP
jgi:hypothetical protein